MSSSDGVDESTTFDFAAPNMTAVGVVGAGQWFDLGAIPIDVLSAFTAEAWIAPHDENSTTAIVVAAEFQFLIQNGLLNAVWQTSPGGFAIGTTPLAAGVWYHVAVTYDGTTVNLYLDGAPEATATFVPATPGRVGVPLSIGRGGVGILDVWNTTLYDLARAPAEVATSPWVDSPDPTGLVANFDFSVAPPHDTSGQHFPITPVNAVSQTVAPAVHCPPGPPGLVAVVGMPDFSTFEEFTVSVWAASETGTGSDDYPRTLFSSGDVGYRAVILALQSGSITGRRGGEGDLVTASVKLEPGDWHNVAMTWKSGTLTLFLDGNAVGSGQITAPLGATGPGWYAGTVLSGGHPTNSFTGHLQWLSVWSRALSPAEIVSQQYQEVGEDPGIVVDIPMDAQPTDVVTGTTVVPGESATVDVQRLTVTSWTPPPAQVHPGGRAAAEPAAVVPPPPGSCPVGGPLGISVDAFSEEHIAAVLAGIEPSLEYVTPELADLLRGRVESATREAFERARHDPGALRLAASWRLEGDEQVLVHHLPDGDVELLRVPAADIDACQQWWATFLFALLIGVMDLFFIGMNGTTAATWLQRRVIGNVDLMAMLTDIVRGQPAVTAAMVTQILRALYSFGLLKSLLWTAASHAGWLALGRVLLYITTYLLPGEGFAAAALFAARAAVLVTSLTGALVGTPGHPGYNQSCGSLPRAGDAHV